MKKLFRKRRFSFWYFVLMFVVLVFAIVINYLFHTTEAVTCLSTGDGLCQTVSRFTLFEILAYASIILLVILIVYSILFNERKAKDDGLKYLNLKTVDEEIMQYSNEETEEEIEEEIEEETTINDDEVESYRDTFVVPIPLGVDFEETPVKMPRRLRINVLKDVLKPIHQSNLEELENRLGEDEKSLGLLDYMRLNKLRVHGRLSEYQLEKEMDLYNNALLNDQYEKKLWLQIQDYLKSAYGDDYNAALDSLPKADVPIKSVRAYNNVLLPYFFDEEQEYDGVKCDNAVDHFVDTSTRKELFELADKYDVNIPKYLTKADLKERLVNGLVSEDKYDNKMQENVDQASVKVLKQLLEENGLNSDPYYTKARMVEMLMQMLCDKHEALQSKVSIEETSSNVEVDFTKTPVVMQRELRVKVLRETLRNRQQEDLDLLQKAVKEAPSSLGITDYMMLNKLKAFNMLSEYQLEKLMDYYKEDALNQLYVDNLWISIDNYLGLIYSQEEKEMALDSLPKIDKPIKSVFEYNREFLPFFTDKLGEFDGIDCKKAVNHLVTTSSRKELFELADKYGINVPKYLTKADLKERLVDGLVAQDNYDDLMQKNVDQATVKVLKQMLEENNLNPDPYYTKERMVEMMIDTFCQLK